MNAIPRQIRVFISSTFRDMQEERDILVKKIFPQLRKLCEDRAVVWTEVDLRWGIMAEETSENNVLPLCLDEIERCRPWFIGLLGERYGWIPDEIKPEWINEQPWLKEHRQHSVTEMEILHGVLRNPQMADHSLFYFRNPRYLDKVPEKDRHDFISESGASHKKLEDLKQRIRDAYSEHKFQFPPRENYTDPKALGEQVLADFTAIIEKLYPKEEVPDPIDQEAMRQEAYAQSRRLAFIGRQELLQRMDEHCTLSAKPLILTGESGCGKSALLAEWVARWRKDHSDDLIIQHYMGSTPDSTNWQGLLRRILSELKRAFAITDDIPLGNNALCIALDEWIIKAAGLRRVIIAIDALNQLSDNDAGQYLGRLSVTFPANFRIIVSTLPGRSLDILSTRDWEVLNIPLFVPADIAPAALAYLKIFGKIPPREVVIKLESTPAACNPLYLRAVLDELRQFGKYEELTTRVAEYVNAPDLPKLFDRILARWHKDFGDETGDNDLVRRSLCLIACARFGLSETELLDLLGKDGEPLPRRLWTPFYLAAENALTLRVGLLNFGHDHLYTAVWHRWLEDVESLDGFRLQLSKFFEHQPANLRKAMEFPWQLREQKEADQLRRSLVDLPLFLLLRTRDSSELLGYWIWLKEERIMGQYYLDTFEVWSKNAGVEDNVAITANAISVFLYNAGLYTESEFLMRRTVEIDEKNFGSEHPNVALRLNNLSNLLTETNRLVESEELLLRVFHINKKNLGIHHVDIANNLRSLVVLYQKTDRLAKAEPLARLVLELEERQIGPDHPNISIDLNNLAMLLEKTNRSTEAEPLMRRALAIAERSFGPNHPNVARHLHNLSALLEDTNRLAEAEPLVRRALTIDEHSLGPDHPDLSKILQRLAALLKGMSRLVEAEPLMRRAIEIDEHSFGPHHPQVAISLSNLAVLLKDMNRSVEAEALMRRALAIDEHNFDPHHTQIAISLNNLAVLLKDMNRLAEAEPLMRRSLAIDEHNFDPHHTQVALSLNNLAQLLKDMNRLAEAEPLMRRSLMIDEKNYGPDDRNVARDLNNLASLLKVAKRFDEAEPLMRRAVKIFEESLGPNHPNVAIALNHLALLLRDTNRLPEAERLMRRVLAINEQHFGADHINVITDINNLAELLMDTNQLAEAELFIRRGLQINERYYGTNHPNFAANLNNLALLLQETNQLEEAESLMRRVLAIDEQSYGKVHSNVARDLNNLGQLLRDTNRFSEAELLMRQAVEIFEKTLDSNHPSLAVALQHLADLLKNTSRPAEAEPLMRRAIMIDELSFGSTHPKIAIHLNSLALLLREMSRLAEAEALMQRVIGIFLDFTVTNRYQHPHLQTAIQNYIDVLQKKGYSQIQVFTELNEIGKPYNIKFG